MKSFYIGSEHISLRIIINNSFSGLLCYKHKIHTIFVLFWMKSYTRSSNNHVFSLRPHSCATQSPPYLLFMSCTLSPTIHLFPRRKNESGIYGNRRQDRFAEKMRVRLQKGNVRTPVLLPQVTFEVAALFHFPKRVVFAFGRCCVKVRFTVFDGGV